MSKIYKFYQQYSAIERPMTLLANSFAEIHALMDLESGSSLSTAADLASLGLVAKDGSSLSCVQSAMSVELDARREAVIDKAFELLKRAIEQRVAAVREALGVEKVDTLQSFIEWVVLASSQSSDVEKLQLLGMVLGAVQQFNSGVLPADVKLTLVKPDSASRRVLWIVPSNVSVFIPDSIRVCLAGPIDEGRSVQFVLEHPAFPLRAEGEAISAWTGQQIYEATGEVLRSQNSPVACSESAGVIESPEEMVSGAI